MNPPLGSQAIPSYYQLLLGENDIFHFIIWPLTSEHDRLDNNQTFYLFRTERAIGSFIIGVGFLIQFLFLGIVFCWGTFVCGSYLPTATTWLYGSYHLLTAHLPLTIGLAAILNARADSGSQPWSQLRNIRNNGLMLVIVLKQLWLGRLYMISITNFFLNSLSISTEG